VIDSGEGVPVPAITWNDTLVNNVRLIDEQHMRLVDMINGFYAALSEKQPELALVELLRGLIDYVGYHFSAEESLMNQYAYPAREDHVREHQAFTQRVGDWYQRVAKGQLVVSFEITNYLRSWLVNHISVVDRKLCEFLKTQGVT
jgi:hemerythrin-like metal-binding protein